MSQTPHEHDEPAHDQAGHDERGHDEPGHDQDAEPPTPTGEEPPRQRIDADDDRPGAHPDPPPEGDTSV